MRLDFGVPSLKEEFFYRIISQQPCLVNFVLIFNKNSNNAVLNNSFFGKKINDVTFIESHSSLTIPNKS
jgi:hypothetical protein